MRDVIEVKRERWQFAGVMAVLVGLMALSLMFAVGCVPTAPDPPPQPNISFSCIGNSCNTGEQSNGQTGAQGPANLPEGTTIRVGIFGHDCPANVTPPNNGSGQIRSSCRGAGITATPKDRNGVDLDASVHGTQIEWSVTGGTATCTGSYLGNVFNQFCSCPAGSAGTTFSLTAKVKNVTGVLNGSCIP